MKLKSIVESLIFAADRPVSLKQLRELTNTQGDEVKSTLKELIEESQDRGLQIVEVSNGYSFRTHPDNAGWVKKLLAGRPARLTRAMLETLAIVAYRQPITRPEIDDIRGVDTGGTLRVLAERSLIRIVGKKEEVGRPLLYGTTKYFLEFFQLKDLKGLPSLKEFTELSEEHAEQVEIRFGEGATEAALEQMRRGRDEQAADEAAKMEAQAAAEQATEAAARAEAEAQEARRLEEEEAALAALDLAVSQAESVAAAL